MRSAILPTQVHYRTSHFPEMFQDGDFSGSAAGLLHGKCASFQFWLHFTERVVAQCSGSSLELQCQHSLDI